MRDPQLVRLLPPSLPDLSLAFGLSACARRGRMGREQQRAIAFRGIRVLQAALPFCTNRKPELRRVVQLVPRSDVSPVIRRVRRVGLVALTSTP